MHTYTTSSCSVVFRSPTVMRCVSRSQCIVHGCREARGERQGSAGAGVRSRRPYFRFLHLPRIIALMFPLYLSRRCATAAL
jgi:hypothetical protein